MQIIKLVGKKIQVFDLSTGKEVASMRQEKSLFDSSMTKEAIDFFIDKNKGELRVEGSKKFWVPARYVS